MFRILLKDTTYFDFGREKWILNFLKDYCWFMLECFRLQWPFNTGGGQWNMPLGFNKWWLRPLSRGDRLREVKITVIKGKQIWNFDNWPLNAGRPLITVPLNTGSTVLCRRRLISSPFPPENHVILPIILHPYSLPHRRLTLTSSCSENEFKNNVETQNIRVKKSDALQH